MPLDLLASQVRFNRLRVQDADVFFLANLELPAPDLALLERLIVEIPWRTEHVVVWGKRMPQPRLIAWFGDVGKSYAYSGIQLHPTAWFPLLLEIKARVEDVVGSSFNTVLLNYYRDHQDSMGFHSDDEPELGLRPVIASVSLGEERTFVMKHKSSKLVRPVHLRLPSGSLLLMKGDTQMHWKHGIPKQIRPCGPRINLTFRRIVSQ
jgi:alkylated DNA repair dioxygenase AlkB